MFSSDHLPEGERVITVEVWKEYCYKLGISSAATGDAKRMAFNRAKKALIAEDVVGIWEEHVWPLANLQC